MFEAVFGAEMPLPLRFFIAFLFVLALIGGAAYLLRRFGAGAMNSAALRGRQPRLAVIDAAQIDGRRRLLLIRRDNVEHLIMIGGPSDVVVEPNIVRATPATQTRETPRATGGIADAMPRTLAENSIWPLQPEPAARAARNTAPAEEGATWSAPPEPPAPPAPRASQDGAPRAQNTDRLAGLADISRGISEPEPPPRRSAEPKRATPPTPVITPTEDHNLAEMAHRLESALQRPRPVPDSIHIEPMPRSGDVLSLEPKLARSESKPAVKPAFDSLEQEMASLLGRPTGTGKT